MTRVLVVDDHSRVADAVVQMVRLTGCEAVAVHSGREALDHLRAVGADLVVLDVSMPGMSGLEVLQVMAAEGMLLQTRVLMFSASDEMRAKSLLLGASDFVLKSDADELIEKLEHMARCSGSSSGARSTADAHTSHGLP